MNVHEQRVARVAGVMRAHQMTTRGMTSVCGCGWTPPDAPGRFTAKHRDHVAAAIVDEAGEPPRVVNYAAGWDDGYAAGRAADDVRSAP